MRYHDMTKVAGINSSGLFFLAKEYSIASTSKDWRKVAVTGISDAIAALNLAIVSLSGTRIS
jgi:hypothetical protein